MRGKSLSRFFIIFQFFLFFSYISSIAQVYNQAYKNDLAQYTEFTWDSIQYGWTNNIRFSFRHNSDGTLSEEVFKSWNDEKKSWTASTINFFKYDNRKRVIEKYNKFRSAKTAKIISNQKITYSYHKDRLHEEQVSDIGKKDAWLITSMVRYGYDTLGRLESKITSKYKKNSFFTCGTENTRYDTLGNLIRKEWESGCTGTDIISGYSTFEYDSLKRKLSEYHETIDGIKILKKYKYKDGKLQKIQLQNWNKKDSTWCDSYIEFYFYNQLGDVTEKLQQVRNNDNSRWINGKKTHYVYNPDYAITAEVEQGWDEKKFTWSNTLKREYKWVDK